MKDGITLPDKSGWRPADWRKFGHGVYQTYDLELVEEMAAAVEKDVADCKTCQGNAPGSFFPSHSTGHYRLAVPFGFTYHCRSWSRWYNPTTKQMEGHAHCTCDGCF